MAGLDADLTIACTLSNAGFRERRAFARQRLIPKISNTELIENGLIFWVKPGEAIEEDLANFVRLEQQCCGFLNFTILKDDEESLNTTGLRIEGPPDASATIQMFAQVAQSGPAKQTKELNASASKCGCNGASSSILGESGEGGRCHRTTFPGPL